MRTVAYYIFISLAAVIFIIFWDVSRISHPSSVDAGVTGPSQVVTVPVSITNRTGKEQTVQFVSDCSCITPGSITLSPNASTEAFVLVRLGSELGKWSRKLFLSVNDRTSEVLIKGEIAGDFMVMPRNWPVIPRLTRATSDRKEFTVSWDKSFGKPDKLSVDSPLSLIAHEFQGVGPGVATLVLIFEEQFPSGELNLSVNIVAQFGEVTRTARIGIYGIFDNSIQLTPGSFIVEEDHSVELVSFKSSYEFPEIAKVSFVRGSEIRSGLRWEIVDGTFAIRLGGSDLAGSLSGGSFLIDEGGEGSRALLPVFSK